MWSASAVTESVVFSDVTYRHSLDNLNLSNFKKQASAKTAESCLKLDHAILRYSRPVTSGRDDLLLFLGFNVHSLDSEGNEVVN